MSVYTLFSAWAARMPSVRQPWSGITDDTSRRLSFSPACWRFCRYRPPPQSAAATQWWADVSALADDGMEGRLTGSPGYDRAAAYVISRLKAEGLKPAGINGFLQPVAFEQQMVDQDTSQAELVAAMAAPRRSRSATRC